MRDFDNPNKELKFRDPPYSSMREEEKCYVIYNMYRRGHLQPDDVKSYIAKSSLKTLSFWSFPFVFGFLTKSYFKNLVLNVPYFTKRSRTILGFASLGVSWLAFSYLCPLRLIYMKEKSKVMDYIDVNLAESMYEYNAMLPRFWTENRINFFLTREYLKRHVIRNTILFAPEGIQEFSVKETSFLKE